MKQWFYCPTCEIYYIVSSDNRCSKCGGKLVPYERQRNRMKNMPRTEWPISSACNNWQIIPWCAKNEWFPAPCPPGRLAGAPLCRADGMMSWWEALWRFPASSCRYAGPSLKLRPPQDRGGCLYDSVHSYLVVPSRPDIFILRGPPAGSCNYAIDSITEEMPHR